MLAFVLLGVVASAIAAPAQIPEVPVPPKGVAFVYRGDVLMPFCLHGKFPPGPLPIYAYHLVHNKWVETAPSKPLKDFGPCVDSVSPHQKSVAKYYSIPGGCDKTGKEKLQRAFAVVLACHYQCRFDELKIVCG